MAAKKTIGNAKTRSRFVFGYVQGCLLRMVAQRWLFVATKGQSAATNQQSENENQAARINAEIEIFHLSATAAKKENNQQNPRTIATVFFAAAVAFVVEHSVEHISHLRFPNSVRFLYLTFQSLFHNMDFAKIVLQLSAIR